MSIYKNAHVSCMISYVDVQTIRVQGKIDSPGEYSRMEVIAPAPIQRMTSYHGSGLPHQCPSVAFDNTPNHFLITSDGSFDVDIKYPNSYYLYDGFTRIPPSIFFKLIPEDGTEPIVVQFELQQDPALSLRSLTHRPQRTGPGFYSSKDVLLGVPTSAEKTMRAYSDHKLQGYA